MKDEEFHEKLTEKAREAIEAETSDALEISQNASRLEKAKKDKKIDSDTAKRPFTWDPRETDFFIENRKSMSNDELKEFMQRDSDFQEKIDNLDEWDRFSRREEREVLKLSKTLNSEKIAEKMDRDTEEVKIKMRMLGLNPEP